MSVTSAPWLCCPATRELIGGLDATLDRVLAHEDPWQRAIALHLTSRRGKRLRGTLVLLCGIAGAPAARQRLVTAAAAVELLHLGSLIHDDVIDQSDTRRGHVSVHRRFGNVVASLAGAYIFSHSYALIASLGSRPLQTQYADMVERMCEGQIAEVESTYDRESTIEGHLDVIRKKTAALFGFSCALGATLGGRPSAERGALRVFGEAFGTLFQLRDDLQDILGDAQTLGKAPGSDLKRGVYTLAVLATLGEGGETARRLAALLGRDMDDPERLEAAVALVRNGPGAAAARAAMRQAAADALAALAGLADDLATRSLRRLVAAQVGDDASAPRATADAAREVRG
jgi:geranylgeranyl pyrophosphate synthase